MRITRVIWTVPVDQVGVTMLLLSNLGVQRLICLNTLLEINVFRVRAKSGLVVRLVCAIR